MGAQSAHSIPPEHKLADLFISRMPRSKSINEKELKETIDWNDPAEKALYNKYRDIALGLLVKQEFISKHTSAGVGVYNQGISYHLTEKGRELKDDIGYLKFYKEKRAKELLSNQAIKAENKWKIWNLQTRQWVLGLSVLGSLVLVLSLWERFSADSGRLKLPSTDPSSDSSRVSGSPRSAASPGSPGALGSSPKKHRPKPVTAESTVVTRPRTDVPVIPTSSDISSRPSNVPLRTEFSNNITIKLMKAAGNSKAHTVTFTVTLSSSKDIRINVDLKSIFDGDGNEYTLKSFTHGAGWNTNINLTTDVPFKCTYTFDGIPTEVKSIKLFNYRYYYWVIGQAYDIEFRDVPIDWK